MKKVILLDSASTISLMCNEDMVDNLRPANQTIKLDTNGGTRKLTLKVDMAGLGEVNFDHEAIANIFGLSDLKKKYRITYDSEKDDIFHVHVSDGNTIKFRCNNRGLYTNKPTDEFLKKGDC